MKSKLFLAIILGAITFLGAFQLDALARCCDSASDCEPYANGRTYNCGNEQSPYVCGDPKPGGGYYQGKQCWYTEPAAEDCDEWLSCFIDSSSGRCGQNRYCRSPFWGSQWRSCGDSCTDGANHCEGTTYSGPCGETCNGSKVCCNPVNPNTPTISSPANGSNHNRVTSVTLDWSDIVWNEECTGTSIRNFTVCVGTNAGDPCSGGSTIVVTPVSGDTPLSTTAYTQSLPATYYWKVMANNKADRASAWSSIGNFNITNHAPSITSTSPSEIPSNGPSTLTLTTTDLDGGDDIGRVYLAFNNCVVNPADAGWSNFEHINANFGGVYSIINSTLGVAVNNSNAACTGTAASPPDPWGPAPGSNTSGTFTLNSVTNTPSGNNMTSVFSINTNGFPATPGTSYNYYAMVRDRENLWHTGGLGTNWSKQGTVCVEGYSSSFPYIGNWSQWGTCRNDGSYVHKRTRSRSCYDDCPGINDCTVYLGTAASCPVDSNGNPGVCELAGDVQTQVEDCTALVRGNLYDASDCGPGLCTCDSAIPLDVNSGALAVSTFAATNPWGLVSPSPFDITAGGAYSFSVYLGPTGGNAFHIDFQTLFDRGQIGDINPKVSCPTRDISIPSCTLGYGGAMPCRVPPETTYDYGFFRKYGGWWQVSGGNVHADTAIVSNIPASVAAASQRLILDNNGRNGIATYETSLSLGSNLNALVSGSNRTFQQTYQGLIYNYAFFDSKLKSLTATSWNGSAPLVYNQGTNDYMLVRYTGASPLTITGLIVAANQKYIILVPGNVNVTGNITVANGGYLAVISGGNITFGSDVVSAQGWFLSDGMITIASRGSTDADELLENLFQGQGSFVAWNGFSLNRDRGVRNNTVPPQTFLYRPDFVTSIPSVLKFPYSYYAPYNP